MNNKETEAVLDEIVASLKEAGFEPYEQLTGYVEYGNLTYITRKNGARDKITQISVIDIKQYLAEHENG